MRYVTLGSTGLRVSRLALGCSSFGGTGAAGYEWSFGYDRAKPIIDRAIELGINYFDTADVYSYGRSEEILGRALDGRRSEFVISTKVGLPMGKRPEDRGLGRKHVTRSLQNSLGHLRTDWIDLYQIHRWDYETPPEEFLVTLTGTVGEGKVRHIGASSTWAWQLEKALCISESKGLARFETMQNHYNLVYREEEREMIPLCREEGVAILPWSPLARGFLSGRYKRNVSRDSHRYNRDTLLRERFFKPEDFDVLEALEDVASGLGAKPSQVALAWLLSKKDVAVPVVGPTSIEQLDELVESVNIKLSRDRVKRLEEMYVPHAVLEHS